MSAGPGSPSIGAPGAAAAGHGTADGALLEVRDLKTYFPVLGGLLRRTVGHVYAVDGVNLDIRRGETMGLVGE